MQNDGTRYLLWAILICVLFFFLEASNGQTLKTPQTIGVEKYQELKAAGALSTRPKPVHFPKKLRPENIINADVTKSNGGGLLLPLDETFAVVPFTNGTQPEYRNDDGSTTPIPLSFTFTFYGNQFNQIYINNNGNISFEGSFSTFTPEGFPVANFGMVAPFWGDVDTRNAGGGETEGQDGSGVVYYKSEANRFTITWDAVGYYNQNADKVNTFQVILTDGTDPLIGVGNNIAFSFGDMQWTTGDASGGSNGFGGSPATVGANRGDGANFALIGRFDHDGVDYDGPGGNADGVSYLDDKIFAFDVTQGAGTIAGTKFRDDNGDGIQQPGEPGIAGWTIRLDPGPIFTTTDADGDYFFSFLSPNTYTVSEVQRANWQQTFPTTPGTHTLVIDAGQTFIDTDFGNQPIANVQDLAVSVAGGIARPGFQKFYGIAYENRGTADVDSDVIFNLPPELSFINASPGGNYDAPSHSVTWDVGLVTAGFRGWLWVQAQIPAPPAVVIGTPLTSSARIEPVAGDANPIDNFDSETQIAQGSFDPNDKLVTPEGAGPSNLVSRNDTLAYQIRFQNTGNDTAFTVVIRDLLDEDLDLSTVKVGASSHPFVFSIVEPRELVWTFNNIQLPDSNINEPESHGFVKFTVEPHSSVQTGTVVSNNASIFFDFNEPVITNTVTNQIGSEAGDIAVSPTSFNFGEVMVNSFLDQTFVVSNADLIFADLTVSSTTIIGANADQFSVESGGGSFTLTPGQGRNLVVRFNPTSGGTQNATLRISSDDENEATFDIPLSGNGDIEGLADITVAPAAFNYGPVATGNSLSQIFVVTNDAKAVENLVVSSTDIVGANSGEFGITSGGGSFTLTPGQSRNVTVNFNPTTIGVKSAALRFFSNDPDENPFSVTLSGSGTGLAEINVSPGSFNFGSRPLNSTTQQGFTISNSSLATDNLIVDSSRVIGGNANQFAILSGGGSFTVNPGGSQNITIGFTPTSLGFKDATLQIFSNDADENPVNIALSGTGIGEPNITITPSSHNYGQVVLGNSESLTFVVANASNASENLQVSSVGITGTNNDQFSITNGAGSFTLTPGDTHHVVVRFLPTSLGVKNAFLQIVSNDPDQSTLSAQLSGTGVAIVDISVSPGSFNYGSQTVGTTSQQIFIVSNSSLATQNLQVSSTNILGGNANQFSIASGGGSFSLAPGTSRTMMVNFTPTSIGFKDATLQITSNDPDENPVNVSLSGTGTGVPIITVDTTAHNYGQVVIGSSASRTFVIGNANTATANLVVSSINIGGDDASQFSVVGNTTFNIAPGQSQNLTVNFNPTSQPAKSAVLNIFSNDPDNSTMHISLTGKGTINLTTSVFQNAAASKYADVVVVSDVFLTVPPTVATVGDSSADTVTVAMMQINNADKAYKGEINFNQSGTLNIMTMVSQSNVDTSTTRTFGVTLAKPGVEKSVITLDSEASLRIGNTAIQREIYFLSETRKTAEEISYHFGPALTFDQPQKLELNYNPETVVDPGKLFIYQKQNEQWIQLESQVFTTQQKVRVYVNTLGEFKLGYDASFTGSNIVPTVFALKQNYPNPFNPSTTIQYDLPEDGHAELIIYNSLGQVVQTLQNGFQLAGAYSIQWNAVNKRGVRVASGVYFYTLKVGEFSQTRKMLLLR